MVSKGSGSSSRTKKTPEERFWAKVRQEGDCWVRARPYRYGSFDGEPAHRWAYKAMVGEIPPGLCIDHICNNPPCVNPYHMQPVPHWLNVLLSFERGRGRNILMAPDDKPRKPANYRDLVEYLAERIESGEIAPGTVLKLPHPREFPRHVSTVGWRATREWLRLRGLAVVVDGKHLAHKAS